jgi:hypothetical protein
MTLFQNVQNRLKNNHLDSLVNEKKHFAELDKLIWFFRLEQIFITNPAASQVVKKDSKIIIRICLSKSATHSNSKSQMIFQDAYVSSGESKWGLQSALGRSRTGAFVMSNGAILAGVNFTKPIFDANVPNSLIRHG